MIYGSLQVSGFIYLFFNSAIYYGKEEFICTEKHVSSCEWDKHFDCFILYKFYCTSHQAV